MSRETLSWLNSNTLIGCTDKRGTAWHSRASEQDGVSNHYPGPIPIGDVQERLFHWTADSRRIAVETPTALDGMSHRSENGLPARWTVVPDRQVHAPNRQRRAHPRRRLQRVRRLRRRRHPPTATLG